MSHYSNVNDYNMLENSGFEKYSSNGLPTGCTDEDEEKTYSIGYNFIPLIQNILNQ